jgi:hypothetical protein
MPHFHVLLVLAEFVDSLLGELHNQHVYRDTRHRVVFCLYVRIAPTRRILFILAFTGGKLARIWQWF